MKSYIKEIFKLKKSQLNGLLTEMSEQEMMTQRRHFKIGENIMQPVTVWRLFYYIDKHGDFINKGKLNHHKIARAIFNSMGAKRKLEIMEYIDDEH